MNKADGLIRHMNLVVDGKAEAVRQETDLEKSKMKHRREQLTVTGARVPSRYRGLDIASAIERAPAIEKVRDFLDPDAYRLLGSFIACGATGAGKTTLAAVTMREILMRAWHGDELSWSVGKSAWFFVASDLSSEIARCAPWEECRSAELALSASWLCIDDLGTERGERGISEISRIISARYNDSQPTVITTAMTWPQINNRYGEGIARRMLEAEVIELGGSS